MTTTTERDLSHDDALAILRTMRDETVDEHRRQEKATRADGLGYDMKLLGARDALTEAVQRLEAEAGRNEQRAHRLRSAIGDALYLIEDSRGTPRLDNVVEARNVLVEALDG